MTPAQKAACKQKFCNSIFGKLFGAILTPMSALSGGLMGPPCGGPSPADLAKPATSAEGAAARIKADEANVAARRAAVRYLGTVSCKYYPEAEPALISALRGDPSECVRIEAAKAFANGCCCSKKTMAALTLAVNGGTKDGFPSEQSECVRALAYAALQVCVATFVEPVVPPEKGTPAPKEKEKNKEAGAAMGPVPYYDAVAVNPPLEMLREARIAVARGVNISALAYRQLMTDQNHLIGALTDPERMTIQPNATTPAAPATPAPAASPPPPPTVAPAAAQTPPLPTGFGPTPTRTASRGRSVGSVAALWKSFVRTKSE
jgi:hypothetical protein